MIRSIAQRATAFGLVAFLVLSSSRALIPGLCATQAALFGEGESECTAHACCTPQDDSTPGTFSVDNAPNHVECAFCHMATARILTAQLPIFTPVAEHPQETPCIPYSTSLVSTDHEPSVPRAPPKLPL